MNLARYATSAVLRILLIALLAVASPRASASEPAPHALVNLATLPDPPLLDIRYATQANFTREQLYPAPAAFLHRDAVRALAAVSAELRTQGYTLRVFDAYRPLSVKQKMWDLIRDERYVSNPAVNRGRHTRGTAVDVALADLMGNPLPMPSGFDDFTERAHRDFAGATPEEIRHRELLEKAMTRHGFEGYPTEWWHFDLTGWRDYPVLDISIADLLEGQTRAVPAH